MAQYGIAKRNGSDIDACVQAGMVAAAYLQAENEAGYQVWKQTEKADCAKAGLRSIAQACRPSTGPCERGRWRQRFSPGA